MSKYYPNEIIQDLRDRKASLLTPLSYTLPFLYANGDYMMIYVRTRDNNIIEFCDDGDLSFNNLIGKICPYDYPWPWDRGISSIFKRFNIQRDGEAIFVECNNLEYEAEQRLTDLVQAMIALEEVVYRSM